MIVYHWRINFYNRLILTLDFFLFIFPPNIFQLKFVLNLRFWSSKNYFFLFIGSHLFFWFFSLTFSNKKHLFMHTYKAASLYLHIFLFYRFSYIPLNFIFLTFNFIYNQSFYQSISVLLFFMCLPVTVPSLSFIFWTNTVSAYASINSS